MAQSTLARAWVVGAPPPNIRPQKGQEPSYQLSLRGIISSSRPLRWRGFGTWTVIAPLALPAISCTGPGANAIPSARVAHGHLRLDWHWKLGHPASSAASSPDEKLKRTGHQPCLRVIQWPVGLQMRFILLGPWRGPKIRTKGRGLEASLAVLCLHLPTGLVSSGAIGFSVATCSGSHTPPFWLDNIARNWLQFARYILVRGESGCCQLLSSFQFQYPNERGKYLGRSEQEKQVYDTTPDCEITQMSPVYKRSCLPSKTHI